MREQFLEAAGGLGRQSLHDVLEVDGRVNAMAAIDTPGLAAGSNVIGISPSRLLPIPVKCLEVGARNIR